MARQQEMIGVQDIATIISATGVLATTGVCVWIAVRAERSHQGIQEAVRLIRALKGGTDFEDFEDGHGRTL